MISWMHFAYLTQPQVTRQNTVGKVNHDRKTHARTATMDSCHAAGLGLALGFAAATFWG